MPKSLPVVTTPTYTYNLFSQNRDITIRPFTVREEKILLTASETKNEREILRAIVNVVNNCILDDLDIKKLTVVELEHLFLKLRAISINNIIKLSFRDLDDDQVYTFDIDLDSVGIAFKETKSNKIMVSDDLVLTLRPPTVKFLLSDQPENNALFRSIIESIATKNEVYDPEDYSSEELDAFIESLPLKTMTEIQEYLQSLPTLYYKIEFTNSKGNKRVLELRTLMDFFTLQ